MQDQPTPSEILHAVRQLLQADVLPQLNPTSQYRLRVAMNAISLVERQLAEPLEVIADEQTRLQTLIGQTGVHDHSLNRGDDPGVASSWAPDGASRIDTLSRELCRRIRERHIAFDDPELRSHLFATTLAKLAVDQPHYGGLVRAKALLADYGISAL